MNADDTTQQLIQLLTIPNTGGGSWSFWNGPEKDTASKLCKGLLQQKVPLVLKMQCLWSPAYFMGTHPHTN